MSNTFNLYCETCDTWKSVNADDAPSLCPVNDGHSIKEGSCYLFERLKTSCDKQVQFEEGIKIGNHDDTNSLIDDASNGASTRVLYIGNETIDTTAVSDKKCKTDVKDVSSMLDVIKKLKVVKFKYKKEYSDDGKEHVGLIAQDVKDAYPYAYRERDDGVCYVDYKEFICPLIKCIQEQGKKIDKLKSRLNSLI